MALTVDQEAPSIFLYKHWLPTVLEITGAVTKLFCAPQVPRNGKTCASSKVADIVSDTAAVCQPR